LKQDPNPLYSGLSLEDFGWSEHFQAQLADNETGALPVRVTKVHRTTLDVAGPSFEGRINGLSRRERVEAATTGDWVLIDENHRVTRILERKTVFQRKSAGTAHNVQLMAANVDTMFIVTSANQEFNLARVERYLSLSQDAGATPVVLITKADLCPDMAPFRDPVSALLPDLAVMPINALSTDIVEQLSPWLTRGRTLALLGSSGVGKSTLINNLMQQNLQATQGSRAGGDKGRHTTSARSLHRLANGAWLMDTPGIRELQLFDVAKGVDELFEDLAELATQCKFTNCTHSNEPACAVQNAFTTGAIDEERFMRYQKLANEERYNSLSSGRQKLRQDEPAKWTRHSITQALKQTD
jgi:ribosome biogenesis GTPase